MLSKENEESFNKYIKPYNILFYSIDDLIDKDGIGNLICPICLQILRNPVCCSEKINSHSFCKDCIDEYLKEKDKCPVCKLLFEYKSNKNIIDKLNMLSFHCMFKNEGCDKFLSYSEYLIYNNICKYNDNKYMCQIRKYNYKHKEFEKCDFIGRKEKTKEHFNLCAFYQIKCLFCNENILQMNLEEHMKNKCKFGIIKYENGNIYIGAKNNNIKEGYGKIHYSNSEKYEGEFKNDLKDGYGIEYYSNVKYEGEFKNGLREGYGILCCLDGNKYEGQWKNNNIEGIGMFFQRKKENIKENGKII